MNVFELAAQITLDTSEFDRGVDSAEQRGRELGDSLSNSLDDAEGKAERKGSSILSKAGAIVGGITKVIGAGVTAATGAVSKLTLSAKDSYADYEQLKGGVETLFGAQGMSVEQYAKSVGKTVAEAQGDYDKLMSSQTLVMNNADKAYRTAGLSANAYMETVTSFAGSLLQSVGGDTVMAAELADKAIIDMADNANKMGSDMGSIQAAYVGFSRQNYTMLDNLKLGYGGTKSEMERLILDAEKLDSTFKATRDENGNLAMSYADVVNAIHIVQKEQGIAGTTAAEAASTISGSVASAQAAWANLVTGLGDNTQDMGVLIDNFIETALTAISNIVPRIEIILGRIGELATRLIDVIREQLPGLLETLLPPLLSAATSLFTSIAAAIPELLEIILAQMPMVVDAVVSVIPLIAEGLIALLPQLGEIASQIILALVNGITQALPSLVSTAVEAVSALVDGFLNALPQLVAAGLDLLLGLAEGILNAIPQLVAKLPQVITAIVNFFTTSIAKIADTGVKLLTALVKMLPSIIQQIVAVLPQIVNAIVNALLSMIPQIIQAGIDLFVALIRALPQIISTIVKAIPQIINAILMALTDNIPAIIQAGVELFVAIIENLPQIIATIVAAVPQIIAGIVSAFGSMISTMWDVGVNLVKGIWQGLANSVGWIKDKIVGWVGDVFSFIKGLFGIHSPSTLMRDQVGLMIGRGVAEGITDSVADIEDASRGMLGAIPDIEGRDFSVNVRRNMSDSYSGSMGFVVERIEDIMNRFQQTIIIELNDREMARAVRGYV